MFFFPGYFCHRVPLIVFQRDTWFIVWVSIRQMVRFLPSVNPPFFSVVIYNLVCILLCCFHIIFHFVFYVFISCCVTYGMFSIKFFLFFVFRFNCFHWSSYSFVFLFFVFAFNCFHRSSYFFVFLFFGVVNYYAYGDCILSKNLFTFHQNWMNEYCCSLFFSFLFFFTSLLLHLVSSPYNIVTRECREQWVYRRLLLL